MWTDKIISENLWRSAESFSGPGSELKNTKRISFFLPLILKGLGAKSLLDIPCGDYNWMSKVALDGVSYIGADVAEQVVQHNQAKYPEVDFRVLDIASSPLPKCDAVLVRDLFGHITNAEVARSLENLKASGCRWLLSTTFTSWGENAKPEKSGGWRIINLCVPPFSLNPLLLLNEGCIEGNDKYNDKCLGIFDLQNPVCGRFLP
jgi:2-polyprenyl-3-methyl-5-hydroxy-6-metoxy-1,4-benzoquinol methylase